MLVILSKIKVLKFMINYKRYADRENLSEYLDILFKILILKIKICRTVDASYARQSK